MARSSPARSATNRSGWGWAAQRQRGQPQPGRPALGPAPQRLQLGRRTARPRGRLSSRRRLLQGEGQVGLPDLAELAGHPQPVQGQRRVGAGGHDQAELGGGVPEQEPELADHGLAGRLMQVVQDQHHRAVELGQAADEGAQEPVADLEPAGSRPARSPSGRTAPAPSSAASTWAQNRGGWWSPGPTRTQATGPGGPRPPSGPHCPGEQQGLAVAGGRGQQGQRPLGPVVQQGEAAAGGRPAASAAPAPSVWW